MHRESSVVVDGPWKPQQVAETGQKLAQAGMQQTLAFESEDWLTDAMRALRRFANLPGWEEFKTEDFRAWYGRDPHDHHVWGALTNRACRAGVIEWTGAYKPSVSPKTHGHPVKVWRSRGVAA